MHADHNPLLTAAHAAEFAEALSRGVCIITKINGDFARMANEPPGFYVELRSEFTLDPDEDFLPSLVQEVRYLRNRLREFERKLRRLH